MSGDTPIWLDAVAHERTLRGLPKVKERVWAQWLGRLDDEVRLRAGKLLHRVSLRHVGPVAESAPW